MNPDDKDVIKALSNPIGLNLFKLVATTTSSNNDMKIKADFLASQTRATPKQFYSNMSRLINKTGLISRKSGYYGLTNYGKIVYHCLNIINRGSECFWGLKALDNNIGVTSSDIPPEQIIEISAKLVEDEEIRRIVWANQDR
jgi:hypothetical protein